MTALTAMRMIAVAILGTLLEENMISGKAFVISQMRKR
jgi:hypothetical protein